MKRKIKYLFISIFIIFMTGCSNKVAIREINYQKFNELINNKETFILEVVQTGCSHCEEFSPRFKAVLKTNKLTAYSLNLYELTKEEMEGFDDLTLISGTPTVLFFKEGKITNNRINGAVSNEKIEKHLKDSGYIKK